MGQIVLIAEGTLNKNINEIDDIVEIHDDDVVLTSKGYEGYKIIKVDGKTCAEIKSILNPKMPKQNRAIKVTADKWCFMEEKEVWENDKGEWCDLIDRPKYALSFKNVSKIDRTSLKDKETAVSVKDTILGKVVEKIQLDTKNNVLVPDLNL